MLYIVGDTCAFVSDSVRSVLRHILWYDWSRVQTVYRWLVKILETLVAFACWETHSHYSSVAGFLSWRWNLWMFFLQSGRYWWLILPAVWVLRHILTCSAWSFRLSWGRMPSTCLRQVCISWSVTLSDICTIYKYFLLIYWLYLDLHDYFVISHLDRL